MPASHLVSYEHRQQEGDQRTGSKKETRRLLFPRLVSAHPYVIKKYKHLVSKGVCV